MQSHGVDFSGAKDAGKRIWVATGVAEGESLQIVDCRPADELPGSGRRPEECLPALCAFVRERGGAFGCDFPFGLPEVLVAEPTWEEFALAFGARYPSADDFHEACRRATGGRELRRLTDREARVPFAAYNQRLYRQTYHGIRDLLAPLVRDGAASILPMQPVRPDAALLLEICPASTLKQERLYQPYKGAGEALGEARERILRHFEDRGRVRLESAELRSRVLSDRGGDALDSVIAAVTTFRVLREGLPLPPERRTLAEREGWVYV